MKSQILWLLLILTIFEAVHAQIESTFNYSDEGQRICLVDVTVDIASEEVTLHFRDAFLNTTNNTSVYRRALYGTGSDWILQADGILPGTTSWIDKNVNLGEVWEYQIRRKHSTGDAIGYAVAAISYDQSNYRGQMILLISKDYFDKLEDKIVRLKKDLTGDGWYVNELIVAKGDDKLNDGQRVVGVKDSIITIYNEAPIDDKPKVLFVLGAVPLPRLGQGLQPPDGHIEASGARGSDSYYADIDGVFTDTSTYDIPEQSFALTKNYPGDFKWDQDKIPSKLEMAFGRVSFLKVASGSFTEEIAMMANYLDRLHEYRYVVGGQKMSIKTGFNETGYSNSTDASYRCLPALSGGDNVLNSSISTSGGHNQWVKNQGSLMWYMSNQHVPQLSEWDSIGMNATVYSSDQSNFGYGDIANNSGINNWQASVIRRILGYDSQCLISLWTTSGINVFHQAGVGEPLGYACKQIMDHNIINQNLEKVEQEWDTPDWWNRTHFNFFGDPTLRLHQTEPASNLQATNENNELRLEWTASNDENIVGYHVYKSDNEFGVYKKITGIDPIINTEFVDPTYTINDWYMVKAIASQTSGSGIFLNPSHGIFTQANIILSNASQLSPKTFSVFPNPAYDEITISGELKIDKIEIRNFAGKVVLCNSPNSHSTSLLINHLAQGSYSLIITSGNKFTKLRLIKI